MISQFVNHWWQSKLQLFDFLLQDESNNVMEAKYSEVLRILRQFEHGLVKEVPEFHPSF